MRAVHIDALAQGGMHVVTADSGRGAEAGLVAHRGILHPAEYVDQALLDVMLTRHLGFSPETVRSVYRQGRLSAHQRELRARVDARVAEVARAGGNLAALGRALGLGVIDGRCQALSHACARHRARGGGGGGGAGD